MARECKMSQLRKGECGQLDERDFYVRDRDDVSATVEFRDGEKKTFVWALGDPTVTRA